MTCTRRGRTVRVRPARRACASWSAKVRKRKPRAPKPPGKVRWVHAIDLGLTDQTLQLRDPALSG